MVDRGISKRGRKAEGEVGMTPKIWATLIIMIGAAAMIAARRFHNHDSHAGYGIAGWTMVIVFIMWWGINA